MYYMNAQQYSVYTYVHVHTVHTIQYVHMYKQMCTYCIVGNLRETKFSRNSRLV